MNKKEILNKVIERVDKLTGVNPDEDLIPRQALMFITKVDIIKGQYNKNNIDDLDRDLQEKRKSFYSLPEKNLLKYLDTSLKEIEDMDISYMEEYQKKLEVGEILRMPKPLDEFRIIENLAMTIDIMENLQKVLKSENGGDIFDQKQREK